MLNIVDATPTPGHRWLPELATLQRAPEPKRVLASLTRLAVGAWGVTFLDRLHGAENHRARKVLGLEPEVLGDARQLPRQPL